MQGRERKIWTIPNVLTMFRLLLVPIFWVLMLGMKQNYWALGVFVLASMTDVLDGFLARRMQQITDVGKLLDPLADKLMVLSALATLLLRGIIPWMPVVLLGLKEFIMVLGGICLYSKKIVVHSLFVGKFAQAAVSMALVMSFFSDALRGLRFAPHMALLWVGVGAAYTALVVYVRSVIRQLRGLESTYVQRES